jgi:hypothetical protein
MKLNPSQIPKDKRDCPTAEDAEGAEETRKESYQFSVISFQERQLLAFNPSPSMKGEARACPGPRSGVRVRCIRHSGAPWIGVQDRARESSQVMVVYKSC